METPCGSHWLTGYRKSQRDAEAEDFVRHYVEKYDGQLPIWVATEDMEFGSLVRLYGLLRNDDRSTVARELGFPAGAVMYKWLKIANYVRNVCAHHARLWNRTLTYTMAKPPTGLVGSLEHLRHLSGAHRKKVYGPVALIAHLLSAIDPGSDWIHRFVSLMDTFPAGFTVTPEGDMGFPFGWRDQQIWQGGRITD